ncbi:hypothetical protein [Paraburkholderia tuberum]|uniref:Uncharacterized protein n=1 Tax=Paraburkholderia tuberum TaxID=157910 RepID=A0A1H1GY41_9BURK|nr:hypothetical protein [Paraburkholderia tuberum]SDR17778.1 hypothetical protein SAMN05445850_3137 [Paraburkholderia tuberum]
MRLACALAVVAVATACAQGAVAAGNSFMECRQRAAIVGRVASLRDIRYSPKDQHANIEAEMKAQVPKESWLTTKDLKNIVNQVNFNPTFTRFDANTIATAMLDDCLHPADAYRPDSRYRPLK